MLESTRVHKRNPANAPIYKQIITKVDSSIRRYRARFRNETCYSTFYLSADDFHANQLTPSISMAAARPQWSSTIRL